MEIKDRVKIVLGVTAPGSSRLLDGQLRDLKRRGYDVYMMSPDHAKEHAFVAREQCAHLPIRIKQDISPLKDLFSLVSIIQIFIKVKPSVVSLGTPKISLLGMLAAKLLGVRARIYNCWGLRFETETGLKRWILKTMELFTVMLATRVVYVSKSLLENSIKYGTARESKSLLIGGGSSNGVDTLYFNQGSVRQDEKDTLISKYNLANKIVIGFVGRVTRDKGVFELLDVFEDLQKEHRNCKLIMMGHVKCPPDFKQRYEMNPDVIHIPFQDNVPLYMSLFDMLVLPSWREGFPNVPIQAAAMGIPVVVSDATGCVDSVRHDFNGQIVKQRDRRSLFDALERYVSNPELRKRHGQNGLEWSASFSQQKIWDGLDELYRSLLRPGS